jgi:hypothetical protein
MKSDSWKWKRQQRRSSELYNGQSSPNTSHKWLAMSRNSHYKTGRRSAKKTLFRPLRVVEFRPASRRSLGNCKLGIGDVRSNLRDSCLFSHLRPTLGAPTPRRCRLSRPIIRGNASLGSMITSEIGGQSLLSCLRESCRQIIVPNSHRRGDNLTLAEHYLQHHQPQTKISRTMLWIRCHS